MNTSGARVVWYQAKEYIPAMQYGYQGWSVGLPTGMKCIAQPAGCA